MSSTTDWCTNGAATCIPLRYLRAWRHRSLTTMTLYWTLFTFVLTLGLFGALAESVTNALTISAVFTFLVGWGYYSTLRDSYDEQRDPLQ